MKNKSCNNLIFYRISPAWHHVGIFLYHFSHRFYRLFYSGKRYLSLSNWCWLALHCNIIVSTFLFVLFIYFLFSYLSLLFDVPYSSPLIWEKSQSWLMVFQIFVLHLPLNIPKGLKLMPSYSFWRQHSNENHGSFVSRVLNS